VTEKSVSASRLMVSLSNRYQLFQTNRCER